jgi:hypothetical protein
VLSILMFAILGFTIDTPVVLDDCANASGASGRPADADRAFCLTFFGIAVAGLLLAAIVLR